MFKLRRLCSRCCLDKSLSPRTVLALVVVTLCTMTLLWEMVMELSQSGLLHCYSRPGNTLRELQDSEVPPGEAFFFHETSCDADQDSRSQDLWLNARQACAVESAALHHPEHKVFLLVAAPVATELNLTQNKPVHALLQYSNIYIRHINVQRYVLGTPMAGIMSALRRSRYPVSHTSDVLRYTTLLKYRGTYMDLDVIVLKPLTAAHNFVGAESSRSLGAGVINFGPDKVGQEMAEESALELQRTFDGTDWGMNGPGVITRVLQRRCNVTSVRDMVAAGRVGCAGFQVHAVSVFYAFPFWEANMFFRPGQLAHARRLLNNSEVIHFWNKMTASFGLPEGDHDVPFTHYARLHCPSVFQAVDGRL